jgi:hypothetical protein
MGSSILHEAFSIRRPYCKLREEERKGIPKRYGHGLHSTGRTKTRQVPGFEFDEFVTGSGRGCYQPSLPSLVECHLMRLVLVDVHLVSGKERLPDDVDLPTHERRAFPGGAEV